LVNEAIEFLFEARWKETGKPMRDTVWSLDLIEAIHVIDSRYGLSNFKKLSIEPVREV
jgi:hypothetical protein